MRLYYKKRHVSSFYIVINKFIYKMTFSLTIFLASAILRSLTPERI